MEVERLNLVAAKILDDAKDLQSALGNFLKHYSAAHNQRTPDSIAAASTAFNLVRERLRSSTLNELPPSLDSIAKTIGAKERTGLGLLRRIEEAINGGSLQDSYSMMKAVVSDATAYVAQLQNLHGALETLRIGQDNIPDSQAEVTFSLPHEVDNGGLLAYSEYLKTLHQLLRTMSEIAGDPVDSHVFRYAGRGSNEIYLLVLPGTAYFLAKAVRAALDIYERLVRIQHVKAETQQLRIDTAVKALEAQELIELSEGTKDHAASIIKDAVERLDTRHHEVRQLLERGLEHLVRSIAGGCRVSFRMAISAESDETHETEGPGSLAPAVRELDQANHMVSKLESGELGKLNLIEGGSSNNSQANPQG